MASLLSTSTWWARVKASCKDEWTTLKLVPPSSVGKIIVVGLLLVGAYLRVGGLDWGLSHTQPIGPPHHDEPHVMYFITIPWEQFKAEFHEYEIVRPVYMWRIIARPLFTLGEKMGWNSEQNLVYEYGVARSVNSVFGIIGLGVIYVLGVRLGGVRAGLLALALLTVLPGHWYYSQLLKGDLLVATFDSLLLLCAIRVYDRGTRFWYILAATVAGLGMATKPSIMVLLPVVALAHVWRAIVQKRLKNIIGSNTWLTLIIAIVVFCALYPYPFIDYDRWWQVLTAPTSQSFHIEWVPTPESFIKSWHDYNKVPNVFMEMVFGEALRQTFPLFAALFAVVVLLAWRAKRATAYALTLLAAFMVYHSLSFSPPLDDRYALPLAIFVVLFPAVLAGTIPTVRARWQPVVGSAATLLLLGYTASMTWAIYPTFAWGTDVRVATVEFIENQLQPGEIVGEFEAGGRQSLPFNRATVFSTRVRSHEEEPHMFRFSQPDYLVVPIEPMNYDHAFRYQLYTPALREEFTQYLQSFTFLRRFGHEPQLFGRKLPRLLSTPVFDVYRYHGPQFQASTSLVTANNTWRTDTGITVNPRRSLSFASTTSIIHDRSFSRQELTGKVITTTIDISELKKPLPDRSRDGVLATFMLFDGAPLASAPAIPADETDIMFLQDAMRTGLVLPLKHPDLKGEDTITVAYYFEPGGRIELYLSRQGRLIGRMITPVRNFSSLRLGLGVAPRDPHPTTVTLKDMVLNTPKGTP